MPDRPTELDASAAEPASEETRRGVAVLKRWWKTATTLGGVLATVGVIGSKLWAFGAEVAELRDTIRSNKIEVSRIATELDLARDEYEAERDELLEAIQASRSRDQEVVTNLRIAVAALQAAQGVRDGRMAYDPGSTGASSDNGEDEPPRSASVRRIQADRAEADARRALQRAQEVQDRADEEDPFAGLMSD